MKVWVVIPALLLTAAALANEGGPCEGDTHFHQIRLPSAEKAGPSRRPGDAGTGRRGAAGQASTDSGPSRPPWLVVCS
jgi:hypothetical protein